MPVEKKKNTAEKKPGKKIVKPNVPAKRTTKEEDPLDNLESVRISSTEHPSEGDVRLLTNMASLHLTPDEVCGCLDISRSRFEGSLALQAAYQRGLEIGKASLRRLQWISAKKGNAIMQIFLGKQILGQKDLHETKKDDGSLDADRKSFEDKLKSIIDVTPTDETHGGPDAKGAGDCQLPLETLGQGQSALTPEEHVVESGVDAEVDPGVVHGSEESA